MRSGFIFLLLGIQVQAATAIAQIIITNEVLPGTHEYYLKYIEGRYRYANGSMVPASDSVMPFQTHPFISSLSLQRITGEIVQIPCTNAVILRTTRQMPTGADRWDYVVLQVDTTKGISVGQTLVTNMIIDGKFECHLASGSNKFLVGYRSPKKEETTSFDEYMEVFKHDNRKEPLEEVIRVDRILSSPEKAYMDEIRRRAEEIRGTKRNPQTNATANAQPK